VLKAQGEAYQASIKARKAWMGYGHPSPFGSNDPEHFTRECALVKSLEVNDDQKILGPLEAWVIDNHWGRELMSKLRVGSVSVSSRGPGSLVPEEYKLKTGQMVSAAVMQPNYRIKGFDFVRNNSVLGTEVSSVKESEDDDGGVIMTIEELKKNHPDLFEEVKKAGYDEGYESAMTEAEKMVDEAVDEKSDEIKQSLLDSGEYVTTEEYNDLLDAMEAAGYVAIDGELEEEEDDDDVDDDDDDAEPVESVNNKALETERAARKALEQKLEAEIASRERSEAEAWLQKELPQTVFPEQIAAWIEEDGGPRNVEEAKSMLETANERAKVIYERSVSEVGGSAGTTKVTPPNRQQESQEGDQEALEHAKRRLKVLSGLDR